MENDDGFKVELSSKPMQFNGMAKIPAGEMPYDININGFGKIQGDFKCDSLHANGLLSAKGKLEVRGDLQVDGLFKCNDSLKVTNNVNFGGMGKINSNVTINGELNAEGAFKCKADVFVTEKAMFAGSAKINGNFTSQDNLTIKGRASIYGNIVGKNITISRTEDVKSFFNRKSRIYGNLAAQKDIIIDDIKVEGDIQGQNVNIGENSIIYGKIFYVDELNIDKDAYLENDPIQISLEELHH
ncbi:hypothetical protein NEF87_003328 [Candidatus Lokiarchaeum ossiferum]|uniref:Polymer-forming cytoskeletal protein n=1 Tax=Candidatus Lokiarchaeum ossiferum TaxID=2951803 RepID=A0ABY6HUM3_9ARCH|nr:hypothetical protein NEF87_003328 [Candidatus Lokiarchaeum sp. B-35]